MGSRPEFGFLCPFPDDSSEVSVRETERDFDPFTNTELSGSTGMLSGSIGMRREKTSVGLEDSSLEELLALSVSSPAASSLLWFGSGSAAL